MADIKNIIAKEALDSILKVEQATANSAKNIRKVFNESKKLNTQLNKMQSGKIVEFKNAQDQAAKATKKLTDEEKALERQRKKAINAIDREIQKNSQMEAAIHKQIKSQKDLREQTNALVRKRDQLDKTTPRGIKQWNELTVRIAQNTRELKANDAAIGRHQRNVGNYPNSFSKATGALKAFGSQLAGALGVTAGVYMAVRAIGSMIKTTAQFERQNSILAGVLGKTTQEIAALTQSQIQLGKATEYTATEVASLQTELAKLGFSDLEIQDATAPILDFAIAVGAELPDAAKLAGAAMRATGKKAYELDDIVATLAVSTTKSALNFQALETGLSKFLPVGKQFGFSLEDQVALYGKLIDSGFDYSTAATSLRNIVLNLADSNGALAQKLGGGVKSLDEMIPALNKLSKSGIDLNGVLKLTDKRSVAAFATFLNGADDVLTLRDSITDVNDELGILVDTRSDNVIGASKRVSSAWEGFTLSVNNSSGALKDFLDNLSNAINSMTDVPNIGAGSSIGIFFTRLFGIGDDAIEESSQKISDFYDRVDKMTIDELNNAIPMQEKLIEKFEEDGNARAVRREQRRLKHMQGRIEEIGKLEEDAAAAADEAAEKKANADAEVAAKSLKIYEDLMDDLEDLDEEALTYSGDGKNREYEATKEKNAKIKKDEADLTAALESEWDDRVDTTMDSVDEEIKAEAEKKRELERIEGDTKKAKEDLAIAAVDAVNQIYQDQLERELQDIQEQTDTELELNEAKREKELEAAEGDKEATAEINAKYDAQEKKIKDKAALEEKKIKEKQFKADKTAAIIKAVINTALGISAALSAGVAGIPLAVVIGALGAIQIATIASQPMPKFAKGTDYSPAEFIAGEAGRELMMTKTGDFLMANKPTMFTGMEGSKIWSNKETERILNHSATSSSDQRVSQSLDRGFSRLEKTIKNKRELHIYPEKREITERSGRYYKNYKKVKFGY